MDSIMTAKMPSEFPHDGNLEEWLAYVQTKVCLSLAVTMYFKHPPEASMPGVLECYDEYLKLAGPQLKWFFSETSTKYRAADAKVLRIPFRRVPEALAHGREWSWWAWSGEHSEHAAPYQFDTLFGPEPYDESLAVDVRMAFPAEMFAGDFNRFLEIVKGMAQRVPVFHGYAGFFFGMPLDLMARQGVYQYLFGPGMRFNGIEIDDASSVDYRNGIKGVNWLTLLSTEFIEKLGGKESLRAQLSEAIVLHPMPWGVMIQAGPAPGIGDVNAGDRLPLYREVNRVLRPVRVVDVPSIGHLGREKTDRWLRRFDD